MEFYNHNTKMEYLNTIENEDVRNLIVAVFNKSQSMEILYDKDLYSFSLVQIGEVMKNINPATVNSSTNAKSRINTYIRWAIENGRRTNNINPLAGAKREWEENFIDNTVDRYLSETDLYDLTESLLNAQDQALIQCIFEGINGKAFSELISLNIRNVNWNNNTVKVKEEGNEEYRTVSLSNRCMKFIENAYNQSVYLSETSESESELLENNGAIFKKNKWKNTKDVQISKTNLAKRLYIIKEKYELDVFTAISIGISGRIKMAADLIERRGRFGKQEFTEIGDKFNMKKMTVGDYSYYDTTKMKNDINSKNLKELYNIEIDI